MMFRQYRRKIADPGLLVAGFQLLDQPISSHEGKAGRGQRGIAGVLRGYDTAAAEHQVFLAPDPTGPVYHAVFPGLTGPVGTADVNSGAWLEIFGLGAGQKPSQLPCDFDHAVG